MCSPPSLMGSPGRRRRALLWLPVAACGALLFAADVLQPRPPGAAPPADRDDGRMRGFLVRTPGCRVPSMDPLDAAVRPFVRRERRPRCGGGAPPLVDADRSALRLTGAAPAADCCYRPFRRAEPRDGEDDSRVQFDKRCVPFNETVEVTEEFVKVTCSVGGKDVYTDFFSFVPNKMKERKKFERRPLNVLIVGIDAVSRLNFHRQMPTTVDYLKQIDAVELLGYNKVGDNTFPNLIPFLTGLSEKQLIKKCWPDEDHRFDDCPFIWKDFKARGFLTSFGEDSSWMGLFNYMRKGFKQQPTDYMWGVFNRVAERQIGNSHRMNVMECLGSREVYKVFLNYINNFVTKMSIEDLPYFSLFWTASLSHDYLNKPQLGDLDYYHLFKSIKEEGYLENTVLIVMSDHGIRWGDIRQTYQGRMEERLPFVFMLLPEWYKGQYKQAYNNLLKNTRRLTTPFDMHETVKYLLDPYGPVKYVNKSRGYNLFQEVPPTRTCEDAEIASHWCTCQHSVEIESNDTVVVEGADFAVNYMNQQLEGYAECSNLSLHNISNARMMTHGEHILNGQHGMRDYMIILQTVPGDGVFEVTLRSSLTKKKKRKFEVMGTISRLNLYGKQSACITEFHLKLYCYCKSLLP